MVEPQRFQQTMLKGVMWYKLSNLSLFLLKNHHYMLEYQIKAKYIWISLVFPLMVSYSELGFNPV